MKTAMLIAASTAAVFFAPAAMAEPLTDYVEYNSADLTTPHGLDRIKARIAGVAERVCQAPNQPTLRERVDREACVADAIAGAEAQLERRVAQLRVRQLAAAGETAAG